MSASSAISTSSSTDSSLLALASNVQAGQQPHPFLPYDENNLNEASGCVGIYHTHWYVLPFNEVVETNVEPKITFTTVGREKSGLLEWIDLTDCRYITPSIFKFQLKGLKDEAQYSVGLRFNTSVSFTGDIRTCELKGFRRNQDFSSLQLRKGFYTGKSLNNEVLNFNDIVIGGCWTVLEGAQIPNVVLLEPERLWIPVVSVYEMKGNEILRTVEFKSNMRIAATQNQKAPTAPCQMREVPSSTNSAGF